MSLEHLYAVVLAGGQGTRFWPRSRSRRPKQLLDIVGSESMIQQTVRRVRPLILEGRILVVTNTIHAQEIRDHVPTLAEENLLVEPQGRNTAPAIGLAAIHLLARDPDAVMVVMPSDHVVSREDVFLDVVKKAARVAEAGHLVTLGMKAFSPETGYGYIQAGEPLGEGVFHVHRFVEKPDRALAKTMVASGAYYWNSGIFVWRASRILEEIQNCLPALADGLDRLVRVLGSPRYLRELKAVYGRLDAISIDNGVLEHCVNAAVIPADMGWNDVGTWAALDQVLERASDGNVSQARHMAIDTTNTIVYSPRKLIATVGVSDLIIVETEDALLVCHKDRAQDVKQVVDRLKQEGMYEYL